MAQEQRNRIDEQLTVIPKEGRSPRKLGLRSGGWLSLGVLGLGMFGAWQAQAQTQSSGTAAIAQYADAVLAIEPVRQAAASQLKTVMGDRPLPVVICSQGDTVKSLSREAREIAVSFCNQTKGIIEGTGLSIAQFNQMTQTHAIDPALRQRIQEELVKLQAPSQP